MYYYYYVLLLLYTTTIIYYHYYIFRLLALDVSVRMKRGIADTATTEKILNYLQKRNIHLTHLTPKFISCKPWLTRETLINKRKTKQMDKHRCMSNDVRTAMLNVRVDCFATFRTLNNLWRLTRASPR